MKDKEKQPTFVVNGVEVDYSGKPVNSSEDPPAETPGGEPLQGRIAELEAQLEGLQKELATQQSAISRLEAELDEAQGEAEEQRGIVQALELRWDNRQALKAGELLELEADYTVPGLQKLAGALGLEDGGNKSDLVTRIRAAQEVERDPTPDPADGV